MAYAIVVPHSKVVFQPSTLLVQIIYAVKLVKDVKTRSSPPVISGMSVWFAGSSYPDHCVATWAWGFHMTHLWKKGATEQLEKNTTYLVWLVVWLPFFIFPYIGLLIIPIDFHIFQRGSNHQPVVMGIFKNQYDPVRLLQLKQLKPSFQFNLSHNLIDFDSLTPSWWLCCLMKNPPHQFFISSHSGSGVEAPGGIGGRLGNVKPSLSRSSFPGEIMGCEICDHSLKFHPVNSLQYTKNDAIRYSCLISVPGVLLNHQRSMRVIHCGQMTSHGWAHSATRKYKPHFVTWGSRVATICSFLRNSDLLRESWWRVWGDFETRDIYDANPSVDKHNYIFLRRIHVHHSSLGKFSYTTQAQMKPFWFWLYEHESRILTEFITDVRPICLANPRFQALKSWQMRATTSVRSMPWRCLFGYHWAMHEQNVEKWLGISGI